MPTGQKDRNVNELKEELEEAEDDRAAAKEESEVSNEDDAAVVDAREGRIPG
jgi:hypothetical protein